MTAFRLAHISDPHLSPPEESFRWGDLASKRLLSRFAWRRKRARHARGVLDAITADIRARAVDHVAITGDLTNFSTAAEFAAARAWLESLGDPSSVTVSPGNHDALVTDGGNLDFAPWRPWLGGPGRNDFPFLRKQGPVALVNLSSARPTGLHLAQGLLGPDQIARAEQLLQDLEAEGFYRIVLLHHPPVEGVVSRRKALIDADALRAALKRVGADLVLHGHAHEALLAALPGPRFDVPVIGIPSASTPFGRQRDQAARWNDIEIASEGNRFRTCITAREITIDLTVATTGQFLLA